MRKILTERNIVIVLFVLVLNTFSLAQEDSKKMERLSTGATTITAAALMNQEPELKKTNSAEPTQHAE